MRKEIEIKHERLISDRRHFHKYPELSFKEKETSIFVLNRLRNLGIDAKIVAETGVLGIIKGERDPDQGGKTILLRADMDALPIQEENNVDYKSENKGVMHACGHDGHIAILLSTAEVLYNLKKEFKGTVKLLFQPAEEVTDSSGAEIMIKEGVLEDPHVDFAIGLHLWNLISTGKVGISEGPVMAASDRFELEVEGFGGHGAAPHLAVDPVIISSLIVQGLQYIRSREIDPKEAFVLSVGKINGGDAFNIIPQKVKICGTTRYFDTKFKDVTPKRIEEIASSIARGMRGKINLNYKYGNPPVINDKKMTLFTRNVLLKIMKEHNIIEQEPTMGGEDMSLYLNRVPGVFIFLGSKNKEKGLDNPHHHPKFDFDENALIIGVEIFTEVVLEYLKP